MKFKVTWGKKLIAGILLAAVVVGGTAAPAEGAGKMYTKERKVPRLWHRIITGKHCVRDFWERVMAVWLMESAVTAVVTHGQL